MGRKIPAKKHRGVKDPLAQQARRLESLKGKINAPPKDPDEQPVPRSLVTLFGLTDPNKRKATKTNRPQNMKHASNIRGEVQSSANPISGLRKLPGESGRDFSLRINSAMKTLHSPEESMDYPHELEAEAEDHVGRRMAELRERRARRRRRAGQQPGVAEERPSRRQRRALRVKDKRDQALQQVQQQRAELVYERVAFGEVAAAPPALQLRRRAPGSGQGAQGLRRGLLLSALLAGGGDAADARRREAADALRRDVARRDAVAAYRALKAGAVATRNKLS